MQREADKVMRRDAPPQHLDKGEGKMRGVAQARPEGRTGVLGEQISGIQSAVVENQRTAEKRQIEPADDRHDQSSGDGGSHSAPIRLSAGPALLAATGQAAGAAPRSPRAPPPSPRANRTQPRRSR